jgi:predicted ATPase/DNA-binding XRE family transcriptional regulator
MGEAESRFGAWLKARRIAYGLTQRELGEWVSCSAVTIRKIEAGTLRPSRQVAELLASVLEVPADERAEFVRLAREAGIPRTLWEGTDKQNATHAGNLPTPTTSLIGRQAELADLQALLLREAVRLVTLTGPPGVGKTRLSLEVAANLTDDFTDGVYFVPLAPIRDPGLLAATIIRALGTRQAATRDLDVELRSYLGKKRILLVLDNFEHLLEAAPRVAELLSSCPHLKVLATGRGPLRLRGERRFPVPPLLLPDPSLFSKIAPSAAKEQALAEGVRFNALLSNPAVALFAERAQAVQPVFHFTSETARMVASICTQLDGLPLAIELAAARVSVLSASEILGRLHKRLGLLQGGAQDLPERQQTLRSAIAWSYDLLDAGERKLFQRLAVFAGGSTLEAIEAVCVGDENLRFSAEDGVWSLVEKNLLIGVEDARGESRYGMLETLREYAQERLSESGEELATRRRHADFLVGLCEQAAPRLLGSEMGMWVARLEEEHDNLRSALGWLIEQGDAEAVFRMAWVLSVLWTVHGHLREGRRWLDAALALASPSDRTANRANALFGAGRLAAAQGDYVPSCAYYEESVAIFRELNDSTGIAKVLNNLGIVLAGLNAYEESRLAQEESLEIRRKAGDKQGVALCLNELGRIAYEQMDYARARSLHEESLAIFREIADTRSIAYSLQRLGMVAIAQRDYASARPQFMESLALWRELGYQQAIAWTIQSQGDVARGLEDYEGARSLYEESLAIYEELGAMAGFQSSLQNLGYLALDRGDLDQATELFTRGLKLAVEIGSAGSIAGSISGLACVAAARARETNTSNPEDPKRAAMLFGAARALCEAIGINDDPGDLTEDEIGMGAARARLGVEVFEEAWAEGLALTAEQAVEYALDGRV